MSDPADQTVALCGRLLADFLALRAGRATRLDSLERWSGVEAALLAGDIGGRAVAAALVFLAPLTAAGPWYRARDALMARLAARLSGGYLIWAPQPADLPDREPHTSDFVRRAEETLARFAPGGRGDIRFPVSVVIRKSDEEGSYVTARGGLAASWAQFTNRVFGHFQLDSTDLHRLPAGDGHLTALIDRVVEAANGVTLGASVEVALEDAWAAQRLMAGDGVAIIGEPPGNTTSSGAGLRRSLRRAVQELRGPLLAREAEARVVCFVGPYTSITQQPVGAALLGFDPGLYQGIDLLCVAAEGEVRPLLDLSRLALLAGR
ncbi:MAG: hypothetical protein U0531_21875 [Dehalococcoidia bacterium]